MAPVAPPQALRTERILDREALEKLGVPRPSRLTYDREGSLYILDAASRRVVKLDELGTPAWQVGGYGEDATSFSLPSDLVVDRAKSLLVLDRGKGTVVAFDALGRFLGARSVGADVAVEALAPTARLLLDPLGSLWILAPRERDLVPLDDRLERARRSRFLPPEEEVGALAAAAFRPGGDVWIYDASAGAVRLVGSSGRLLRSASLADSTGRSFPVELACDRAGFLYVADPGEQRLLVYDAAGVLRLTRSLGGPNAPWRPASIAVGPSDRVAIADPDRGEIQLLTIEREQSP